MRDIFITLSIALCCTGHYIEGGLCLLGAIIWVNPKE